MFQVRDIKPGVGAGTHGLEIVKQLSDGKPFSVISKVPIGVAETGTDIWDLTYVGYAREQNKNDILNQREKLIILILSLWTLTSEYG